MIKISKNFVEETEFIFIKEISNEVLYKIVFRTDIEDMSNYFQFNEYIVFEQFSKNIKPKVFYEENKEILLEKAKLQEEVVNKENNIKNLKTKLNNSDYEIIKSVENFMINNTYDATFSALVSDRTNARNEINLLDGSIENTEDKTLELEKNKKINEMNSISKYTIVNGVDIGKEHFRLNEYDQINLMMLSTLAQQGKSVPYHADGEVCRLFTAQEMLNLAAIATNWIVYHTTYVNLIKHQILGLETIDEVKACYYGMELQPQYQAVLNAIISASDE